MIEIGPNRDSWQKTAPGHSCPQPASWGGNFFGGRVPQASPAVCKKPPPSSTGSRRKATWEKRRSIASCHDSGSPHISRGKDWILIRAERSPLPSDAGRNGAVNSYCLLQIVQG